jgi:uncharacterized membrane protein
MDIVVVSMGRQRQQGVTGVLFALLLATVVMSLLVLAVDGNRLYSEYRSLQTQANAAAIAAADAAQACGGTDVSAAGIAARALQAATDSGFQGGAAKVAVATGLLQTGADQRLGFVARPLKQSNAVQVVLQSSTPRSRFLPGWLAGTMDMRAGATASKELLGSFSATGDTAIVGGDLNQANLLNSLLGAVLLGPGQRFHLSPTNYEQLSQTLVDVGDLMDRLGVGQLADALPLRADSLASALRDMEGVTSPAGELLDGLLANAGLDTLKVADVLQVATDARVPRDAKLPLYGLIMSMTLNLAQDGVFQLPVTTLDIPGITSVEAELHVGRPPAVATGLALQDAAGQWETRFHTADISLALVAHLDVLGLLTLDLPLAVDTGSGDGVLVAASCRAGLSNQAAFDVAVQSSVARIVTGSLDTDGKLQPAPLNVSALFGLLKIEADMDTNIPSQVPATLTFTTDLHAAQQPGHALLSLGVGGGLDGLAADLDLKLTALGIGIPVPLGVLKDTINTLVNTLGQSVLDPLLAALGVQLGRMDVTLAYAGQEPVRLVPGVDVAP